MSANVAHRRGSVVDDTCYRCGLRVYLLERHLATTGQLFHRHCYRDSERTATLQRSGSRPAPPPSSQKENLLPQSQPEVASSPARRKCPTAATTKVESAAPTTSAERRASQGRRDQPANIKSPEVEIPKVEGVAKSSGAAQRKVPESPTTIQLAIPTTCSGPAAKSAKSTENGNRGAIWSLAQTAVKHSSSPGTISSGTTCCPARLTPEDRYTKIPRPRTTVAAVVELVDESSATGSSSAMDHPGSGNTGHSSAIPRNHHKSPVSSVLDRGHPTLSTAGQPADNAVKTTSSVAPSTGTTANVSQSSTSLSPRSISSIDRSCDVMAGTEPARLVLQHLAPGSSADRKPTAATANYGQTWKDCSAASTTTKSSKLSPGPASERISSFSTAFERPSDPDKLSGVSTSPASLSYQSAFIASTSPVSSNSRMDPSTLNTVLEPSRSEPFNSDGETTKSAQHYIPVNKQTGLSTKIRMHLYRPKSLENLLEPSCGRQAHRTTHTEATGTPTRSTDNSVRAGTRRLADTERTKSTFDLLHTTSQSPLSDDRIPPHEARRSVETARNEPIVRGLLENLTKVRQRKLQEPNLASGKKSAPGRQDGLASGDRCSTAISSSGEQLPQQASVKHTGTSPVASHQVAPISPSTAGVQGRTAKQNEYVSLTPPRVTTLKADDAPAEPVGRTNYLTKWQAEHQRRREITRLGQTNVRCTEQEPRPPQSASSDTSALQESAAPVKNSPPCLAVANRGGGGLSSRFSKSVDDLSQVAGLAAGTGRVEEMTEWQLEVERRRAARGSRYVDPERLPRFQRHRTPSTMKTETPKNVRKSMFELNKVVTPGSADCDGGSQYVSSLYRSKKSNLSASVDNLATCHHLAADTSRCSLRPGLTSPEPDEDRKQADNVDVSSDVESRNSPTEVQPSSRRYVIVTRTPMSAAAPANSPTENYYESIDDCENSPVKTCQVGDYLVIVVVGPYTVSQPSVIYCVSQKKTSFDFACKLKLQLNKL